MSFVVCEIYRLKYRLKYFMILYDTHASSACVHIALPLAALTWELQLQTGGVPVCSKFGFGRDTGRGTG